MKIIIAIIASLVFAIPADAESTLTFGGSNDKATFVSMAILKAAYARLGIKAQRKIFPAKRSLEEVNRGYTDGEINRIKGIEEQHPNLILIDVPISEFDCVAYSCDRNVEVKGWESLRQLRIGVRRGVLFSDTPTTGMPYRTVMPDFDMLFDLLLLGRLDVVIATRQTAYAQFKRLGKDCIIINEPPVETFRLYHYLHARHKSLAPAVSRVLGEMKESGEMEAIRAQAIRDYQAAMP